MTMHIRRGAAAKRHAARLVWLRAHPLLLIGVPSDKEDVSESGRAKLDALREQMIAAGLFVAITPENQRATIRRLVGELRGEVTPVIW